MNNYRIRPVTLAIRKAEKGQMTYLRGYGEPILRPYIFWIIEGGQCNIIVDSGISAADYLKFQGSVCKPLIEHAMSFEQGLAISGLTPDDVRIVIQTHLHFDHCYNTAKCRNAKVIVQERELEYAAGPSPVFSSMYDRKLLDGIDFQTINGDATILPGINVVPVPGHTPGCQAVVIDTSAGRAVISGFCSIRENFFPVDQVAQPGSSGNRGSVIVPGIHFDTDLAYQSIIKIKKMADIILPVHEPDLISAGLIP